MRDLRRLRAANSPNSCLARSDRNALVWKIYAELLSCSAIAES